MLTSLEIKDFVIISHLTIDFGSGLSVITGETGAGKSIIMGALGLVLGDRADTHQIREGAAKCSIEATFNLDGLHEEDFFETNGLDFDPKSCILRREINAAGKSRAFINDTPVSLTQLRTLGEHLLNIHSQHANLLLKDGLFQLSVLDCVANNQKEREQYRKEWKHYTALLKELKQMQEQMEQDKNDREYIEYQCQQLEQARLKADEDKLLEEEQEKLTHREDILNILQKTNQILNNEQTGATVLLKEAASTLEKLKGLSPICEELAERLRSTFIETDDIADSIENELNTAELDPQRLQEVQERLDLIYTLERKHHVDSVNDLINLQEKMQLRLQNLTNSDERIESLTREVQEAEKQTRNTAALMSRTRRNTATKVEQKLIDTLRNLGMPHVQMKIKITQTPNLTAYGTEQIDYLFSANQKTQPAPVSQIASGGEISRVMLALKALISENSLLPTIVLDEIDTGVSGEVADRMGDIMQQMAQSMQVITITHLPQIAAKGNAHYRVFKKQSETSIQQLTQEERIREIAQMLSGASVTDAAITNARELLHLS